MEQQFQNSKFEVLNFEFPNFEVRPAQKQIEFELDDLMVQKRKRPGGFEAPLTPPLLSMLSSTLVNGLAK